MKPLSTISSILTSVLITAALIDSPAQAQTSPDSWQKLAREIFQELIEINTTHSIGDTTRASEAMAKRLLAAGLPASDVRVLGPSPKRGNLVARLRGTGARRPLLLLAHIDVVEARREDWSTDPFKFIEVDGYFYGRGTSDDKAMAAIWITNLIRHKKEGFTPDRDIIVALTADEEGGPENGVDWLLKNHKDLIDAEYCLNEGGGGQLKDGKRLLNEVQASEKMYISFRLEVKNAGGHSSRPVRDNAIYHLSAGLTRLADFSFPVKLNEITRSFFETMSQIESGSVAADMKGASRNDAAAISRLSQSAYYNALMRTTCVATRLEGGHADNALPQTATALVNCRVLPGEPVEEVKRELVRVLANEQITVTAVSETGAGLVSPASPLKPEVMRPIEKVTSEMWPGVPVVPVMATGGTDGIYLRNVGIPTYGVSGLFHDINDRRAHGKDERIGIKEFYEGQEFLYRLVKASASKM